MDRDWTIYRAPNGYTVGLDFTGRIDQTGHAITAYYLADPNGKRIFEGEDFGVPDSRTCDSDWAATELLTFLTLQPGDTDEEYFDNYTPEQLAWCESDDAEELRWFMLDLENGAGGWTLVE